MQGTTWHAPGDGWLVAHDLYHHEPGDQGTFAEELMSFGVQEWLESQGDACASRRRPQIDFENAVCYVLSESKGKLDLPAPPAWPASLTEATYGHWEKAYRGGMGALEITQHQDMDDPAWEQLEAPNHVAHALGWIAEGWRRAQRRYPEPALTQAAFEHLEHAMNAARVTHPLGARLVVTWQPEGECAIAPMVSLPARPRRRRLG
jgi:hypothetical protein